MNLLDKKGVFGNSSSFPAQVSEQQGVTYGIDDSRKEGKLQKLKMLLLDEDCKEFLQNVGDKSNFKLFGEKLVLLDPERLSGAPLTGGSF